MKADFVILLLELLAKAFMALPRGIRKLVEHVFAILAALLRKGLAAVVGLLLSPFTHEKVRQTGQADASRRKPGR